MRDNDKYAISNYHMLQFFTPLLFLKLKYKNYEKPFPTTST